jgi:hypothetical protein
VCEKSERFVGRGEDGAGVRGGLGGDGCRHVVEDSGGT